MTEQPSIVSKDRLQKMRDGFDASDLEAGIRKWSLLGGVGLLLATVAIAIVLVIKSN